MFVSQRLSAFSRDSVDSLTNQTSSNSVSIYRAYPQNQIVQHGIGLKEPNTSTFTSYRAKNSLGQVFRLGRGLAQKVIIDHSHIKLRLQIFISKFCFEYPPRKRTLHILFPRASSLLSALPILGTFTIWR